MKIPNRFKIFSVEYTVVLQDDLFVTEYIYGDYNSDLKQLRLQSPATIHEERHVVDVNNNKKTIEYTFDITFDDVLNTYYHELFHCIFDAINESALYSNERLVSNIAAALVQINKTGMYNE